MSIEKSPPFFFNQCGVSGYPAQSAWLLCSAWRVLRHTVLPLTGNAEPNTVIADQEQKGLEVGQLRERVDDRGGIV